MTQPTIGTLREAQAVAADTMGYGDNRTQEIGWGESRRVYRRGGVVYKIGRETANRYEHEALTAWRLAGAPWAPPTSLYDVVEPGPFGAADETLCVLAMPYLPHDGSPILPDDPRRLAILAAAPEAATENMHICGGTMWLIDGVDIATIPPATAG